MASIAISHKRPVIYDDDAHIEITIKKLNDGWYATYNNNELKMNSWEEGEYTISWHIGGKITDVFIYPNDTDRCFVDHYYEETFERLMYTYSICQEA